MLKYENCYDNFHILSFRDITLNASIGYRDPSNPPQFSHSHTSQPNAVIRTICLKDEPLAINASSKRQLQCVSQAFDTIQHLDSQSQSQAQIAS